MSQYNRQGGSGYQYDEYGGHNSQYTEQPSHADYSSETYHSEQQGYAQQQSYNNYDSPQPEYQSAPIKPQRQPSRLRSNSSSSRSTAHIPATYNEEIPPVPSNLSAARQRSAPSNNQLSTSASYNQDGFSRPSYHSNRSGPTNHPSQWDPNASYDATHTSPLYDPAPLPAPGQYQADLSQHSIDLGARDPTYDERTMQHNYPYGGAAPFERSNSYQSGHPGGNGYHTVDDEKSVYSKNSTHLPGAWNGSDQANHYPEMPAAHSTVHLGQPGYPPTPYGDYGHRPGPGMPDAHVPFSGLGAAGVVIAPAPMHTLQHQNSSFQRENRERIMRKRTVKRIPLQDGNLVLDIPVAKSISKSNSNNPEFREMRYTACTTDPDQFIEEKYTLRPWLYGRETEMAIVLTCYNEDDVLFARTMGGVIKNIAHLCGRTRSKTWGPDAWKKVVVIIVADGRKKANERMLKALGLMGCYNEGVMKDHVLKKPVEAHIFEYTTRVQVTEKGEVQVTPCPVQVVFCLKEQNKKKLNSHRWYFNAFCRMLQPNVCILLDVGTKPTATSIYELWKSFDKHPHVGGACGEICVDTGRGCVSLFNPLVASQNFEYKMSNILDKPTESVFGFISVLPGAFSAYRYKALQGRPLQMYFKGEKLHSGEGSNSIFSGNMYLAEDRILCFELVTKEREGWLLRYVKSAKAYTDVPDKVPEFISQRRRWLNGSLFASYYATWHWYRIFKSGQPFLRKLWLLFQVIYGLVLLVFSWFALANFFLAFYFLLNSAVSTNGKDPFGGQGAAIIEIFQNIFIAMVIVVLVCSLGNRPQGSNFAYTSAIVIFALIMGLALYAAGFTTYLALNASGLTHRSGWRIDNLEQLFKTSGFRDIVVSLAATYVMWLVCSILHFEPWHMLTSFVQYLFLTPTYIIILSMYSMCNTNDLSWGTKQSNGPATDLGGATGSASKQDGKGQMVEVKIPTSAEDAEDLWTHYRQTLSQPVAEVKQKRDKATKQEDHAKNFRTNLVLVWMCTNAVVVIVFTSTWWNKYVRNHIYADAVRRGEPIINPYQTVIFWSTAGLSAVRFVGSIAFLIMRMFGH
ncbi:probable Chitin synthase 2 [Ustilago bromivora]|uniref:chitin synthase n=1 Tax=Ustilago bromivora TaxID=307758 RepID=A0A1K0G8M2_9BASI|nr:probable Chitin synthase 2 [Ustilago bromivora]SYW79761.1 probable Chitin synthase 2 [Ustilago bromivora]